MKKVLFLTMMVFSCATILAQGLTKEQENLMRIHAQQKVGQFTSYLKQIAEKGESLEHRLYYKEAALKLFIGQGQEYDETYINTSGDKVTIKRPGVKMQVTSVNRSKKRDILLHDYLVNLANLKYQQVKIETTEIANIRVSNLQKVGNNLYKCVCFFKQSFIGYRDGRPVYSDITEKKVECYIYKEDTPDGEEFMTLLGDVTALETRRVDPNSNMINIVN